MEDARTPKRLMSKVFPPPFIVETKKTASTPFLTPLRVLPPSVLPPPPHHVDPKHSHGEKSASGTAGRLALNCLAMPFGF